MACKAKPQLHRWEFEIDQLRYGEYGRPSEDMHNEYTIRVCFSRASYTNSPCHRRLILQTRRRSCEIPVRQGEVT